MLVIIVRVIIDCSCKYIYINIIDVHQQLICCSYFTINTVFRVLCIYYIYFLPGLAPVHLGVFFGFFFIVIVLPGSIGVLYIFLIYFCGGWWISCVNNAVTPTLDPLSPMLFLWYKGKNKNFKKNVKSQYYLTAKTFKNFC